MCDRGRKDGRRHNTSNRQQQDRNPVAHAASPYVKFRANDFCVSYSSSPLPEFWSSLLLERIVFNAYEVRGVVFRCRMRASPFRKGRLFTARTEQQPRMAIVSFVAAGFIVKPVGLV